MDKALRTEIVLRDGAVSCLEWPRPQAPILLFAHANGFNAQTYASLLTPISERYHAFACDLRGHGFTTLPTEGTSANGWTVFRNDLRSVVEHIRPRSIVLAGHSLGATSSLMAAAQMREQVQGLLLIEPVLIAPDNEPGATDLAARAERRRNVFPSFETAFEAYRGRSIFASWPDAVVADYLEGGLLDTGPGSLRLACAPEWEAAVFRGAPRNTAPLATSISCPITIIVGSKDSATSEQQLSLILNLRPDARIRNVDGASHFLPMERPEIVQEELFRLAR